MTDWKPQPWPIDPEHGRVTGPGFLGDSFHSLRVRELFRYYQPPTRDEYRHLLPINTGNDFVKETGLVSAVDPILAAFANLTTRMMDMRRCVVSMTGAGTSYIIAESTRTLSLTYPHTYEPGDALMLGGGVATASLGGLCEHTCSLLPPPPESDEPFLLEIPDLSKHPKFCNVGYVRNWPHARFYCGAPLRTKNGVTIGTVCVMDDSTRYDGLTEKEKLTMATMADMFMQYFETKEGSRFRKKGQLMEMELSRFISEGFLPSTGAEMTERRNGRLWSESILESKRNDEKERRKKVMDKRQLLQEMEYVKMVSEERSDAASSQASQCGGSPTADDNRGCALPHHLAQEAQGYGFPGLERPRSSTAGSSIVPPPLLEPRPQPEPQLEPELDTTIVRDEPPPEELVAIVNPIQPGIIQMIPASSAKERLYLLETVGTALPSNRSPPKEKGGTFESLADSLSHRQLLKDYNAPSLPRGLIEEAMSPVTEGGPDTNASSSSSGTVGPYSEDMTSTTASTSMHTLSGQKKLSKYEETTSLEPHFRAMFARASTVIKNTIDCDVVFVHGDLEGFYEPDYAESDPHASDEWGSTHFSSSDKSESKTRAKRPKQHRQRSGILGYATSKGSSSARFDGPKNITDLGFDMSELREEHLAFLLKDSKGGKIFSFFDEYPGLEEHEDPEELECRSMLQRFLPGCRSVIIVPLHDHKQVLSSVCFAWTCSDQKTFYGDEEGRFATGVATSLIDDMARAHILSADKAKSEFISSISHELRSPLHGILASSELLLDGELVPHQRSFVETIISCGTTLLDTVNHVLDFQKLNYLNDENLKRVEAPPTPENELTSINEDLSQVPKSDDTTDESLFDAKHVDTDISTIVQEVTEGVVLGYEFKDLSKIFGQPDEVKTAALVAPTKVSNIQVVVDIEDLEGGWVFRSNPAAIKRIVGNIVGNAIKYSNESGWIKITLAAKKIEPAPDGSPRAKVSFIVSDSGKGMSREFLKTRLFTPFTQENPMAAGAGLGLSIVRQLVDMLGGKIDVKSQLGKGTTFRIEAKLTQVVPQEVAKPDLAKPDFLRLQSDLVYKKVFNTKALVLGFGRFDTSDTPEQRGESLLYDSLIRYARDLLHLDVILDPAAPEAAECQVIIVNELASATKLHDLAILKTRPVILMSNSTPRRSVLDRFLFDRDPRLVTFLRKPCGPKKLTRAFRVCLDILENGIPPLSTVEYKLHDTEPVNSTLEATTPDADVSLDATDTSVESIYPAVRPLLSTALTTLPYPVPPIAPSTSPASENLTPVPTSSKTTEAAAVASKIAVDPPPQQSKILCVEDNKINMMLVTTYLKKKGYPFKKACDGSEAIDRVKEEASSGSFDCILMDLQMPVMSGIESTREIRLLEAKFPHQYKRAFIIALTGLAAGSDRREAFDAGVDAFMVKPVSFKDLEKMLQEHVRNPIMLSDERRRNSSILSVESSRGKNIEIKTPSSPLLSSHSLPISHKSTEGLVG